MMTKGKMRGEVAVDIRDWRLSGVLGGLGAVVGGPVGFIAGLAISYANHLSKEREERAGAPAGFTNLSAPPPIPVLQAASALVATKPKIGTAQTINVSGKTYLMRTEMHPGSTNGSLGSVSFYQKV